MRLDYLNYLFGELKDNIEQLKEAAYKEDPDGDRVEYHFDKATGIIERIEKVTADPNMVQFPTPRVIGG